MAEKAIRNEGKRKVLEVISMRKMSEKKKPNKGQKQTKERFAYS